jgi:hypothetical protein
MVHLNWRSTRWDPTCPHPGKVRCSVCGERIQPPFMHWTCDREEEDTAEIGAIDIFICAECCTQIRHGFVADLTRLDAVAQALDPAAPSLASVQ